MKITLALLFVVCLAFVGCDKPAGGDAGGTNVPPVVKTNLPAK